jgi:hypothetical protein
MTSNSLAIARFLQRHSRALIAGIALLSGPIFSGQPIGGASGAPGST